MYTRDKTGPSTDPCGIPDVILQGEEHVPSTTTFCVHAVIERKD